MDRTINWGDDAADARYRTQDTSSTGGDFVVAEDLDGGTVLLEYDYSASEWVSRGPVNLDGNNITNAGSITADALEATTLTIGGTLFEEDANSPFNPSGSSGTYTVANDYKEIIIIPVRDGNAGYDEMQINGDTGSNYNVLNNDGTRTTGNTHFDIPKGNRTIYYHVFDSGSRIKLSVPVGNEFNTTVGGTNDNVGGNGVDSVILSDAGGADRDKNYRVYGRSV